MPYEVDIDRSARTRSSPRGRLDDSGLRNWRNPSIQRRHSAHRRSQDRRPFPDSSPASAVARGKMAGLMRVPV